MKRIICVMMFIIMVFAVIGCDVKDTYAYTDPTVLENTTHITSEPTDETTMINTTEPTVTPTEPATEPTVVMTTEPVTEPSTETTEPATTPIETKPAVTFTEVDEIVYANTTVNIRTGPSTDYEKIGQLTFGQEIRRTGVGDNGWSRVIYNEQTVYMYSDYIQTEKPVPYYNTTYPLTYSDGSCTITITKEWKYNAWCYIAHLEFTDYTRFGSAIAYNNRGSYETTSHAANRLGAIFCVNGPYNWGELANAYAVIRSGTVFHDINIGGDLAIYNSATGKLANAGELGIAGQLASDAVANGQATDTFKFWNSTLVKNGANISNADNDSRAQRTFIGTNGNSGDIYIIVTEGRYADGESAGLTKCECAQVILDLNCTYGVILDGGGSSTIYFNGHVLNSARANERAVVDFIYFK